MFIAEIFYSLQGEGLLLGVPSIFIRTSGCNLRCHWCDTPYASWHPEGEHLSLQEIMKRVEAYPSRYVVLTGGEPMIASEIRELAGLLKSAGYHITIETAATVMPRGIPCDLGSLSPKLSHSSPSAAVVGQGWAKRHEQRRCRPEVIRSWMESVECQLKFVVSSADDLKEILALLQEVGTIPLDHVLLMPEGTDPRKLQQHSLEIARLCCDYGFRFAPRLHIELYGNKRGT
ncbi:MAG: 7-carboxy-7-deazaguanine synthase QueE [Chthoniobacterales bacterium]|nr:7-carboxy-7-deazaguanine synthase QueE [Chthoniobacterales bacterium]